MIRQQPGNDQALPEQQRASPLTHRRRRRAGDERADRSQPDEGRVPGQVVERYRFERRLVAAARALGEFTEYLRSEEALAKNTGEQGTERRAGLKVGPNHQRCAQNQPRQCRDSNDAEPSGAGLARTPCEGDGKQRDRARDGEE